LESGVLFPITKLTATSSPLSTPASGPHLLSHATMSFTFPE
jgi:hypothetical protein